MLDQHDSAQAIVGEDGRIYVFFGSSNTSLSMDGYSIIVEAYGPVLDTSPRQGPRGLTTKVDGTNFAANADVHIYWGHPDGGQLLKVTRSTDGGTFTQVSVKIPDAGNGPITAIDMRARYPAYIPFTVQ
jgi:hypothetical protein